MSYSISYVWSSPLSGWKNLGPSRASLSYHQGGNSSSWSASSSSSPSDGITPSTSSSSASTSATLEFFGVNIHLFGEKASGSRGSFQDQRILGTETRILLRLLFYYRKILIMVFGQECQPKKQNKQALRDITILKAVYMCLDMSTYYRTWPNTSGNMLQPPTC